MPYFTAPSDQLDPNLFEPRDDISRALQHLQPVVRNWLLIALSDGLRRYLRLEGMDHWLHVWLAGSGITYQWEGNTDLDVLFGVDMVQFVRWNPDYQGIPERDVADYADGVLKQRLWPKTARQHFGGQQYEVTFFWAPGTGGDDGIQRIHPYAAYDLMRDLWVVAPPSLPHDPQALYPPDWFSAADRDTEAAGYINTRYASARNSLASIAADTSQSRNASAELERAQQSAMSLFDSIHGGRREAFGEQGTGYGDYANFRWQRAKSSGVVSSLKAIIDQARGQREQSDQSLYGGSIDGPQTLLTRALLHKRPQ